MSRILITGGNGFIGSRLAAALAASQNDVTCLVRKTSQLDRLQGVAVKLAYGDVNERESLQAPLAGKDLVFHLAGCIAPLHRAEFYRVQRDGWTNVLEICAASPRPPVVVCVSSLAAAGPSPRGRLRTELDPLCPVSHYGRSKRAAEQVAAQHADRLPITIVRPSIVFGEADRASLPMFSVPDRFHIHAVPGLLPNRFSLIHVDDLVQLLILAAQRGQRLPSPGPNDSASRAQGRYFAACPEHPTYHQLGRLIGQALDRRVIVLPASTGVAWAIAGVGHVISRICRRPVSYGLDKAAEATAGSWACSPQAAINDLGLSFPVSLLERLRQTVRWYRQHGWL
jgi:nucleoside-diphosphate-sugar epimerase